MYVCVCGHVSLYTYPFAYWLLVATVKVLSFNPLGYILVIMKLSKSVSVEVSVKGQVLQPNLLNPSR